MTHRLIALLALALYTLGILSIGLTRDWRLRHEDNGALQTTLALSHRQLGLARTRAHDVFFNPHTGEATPYGHHPPATALVLAGAFALTGSDVPAVARLTVIVVHIGSVFLLTALLSQFFETRAALLGGFAMATLPMSGFYGRMVNYEPLCLFAVLLQLYGYARFKRTGRRRDLMCLSLGIVVGGLIDWPSFFFTAALAFVETLDVVRRRSPTLGVLAVLVIAAASVFVFDLWHLRYAGRGSMQALNSVVLSNLLVWEQDFTVGRFVLGQIDTFRRFFTETGLIAILLAGVCLVRPRARLSRRLFDAADANVLKRVLFAAGAAALGYVLAAPSWAMMHQYLAVLLPSRRRHVDGPSLGAHAARDRGTPDPTAARPARRLHSGRADRVDLLAALPSHEGRGLRRSDDGDIPIDLSGSAELSRTRSPRAERRGSAMTRLHPRSLVTTPGDSGRALIVAGHAVNRRASMAYLRTL